ncbi:MAG: pirin family protein [Candidatus Kapabacteria bacterium]|nr:pirin family protein [Candidatus Kapabacteria bacterium]
MTLFPASERGHFDFGWLNTYHSFSFGQYFNPESMNFGMLRVLNDDLVAPGEGFGTHPHNNMEIITIPLEGVVMHRDSMGHEEGLHPGDVQVMSAGTGLTHSEFNGSPTDVLKLLQIWIIPNERNVEPRYDQIEINDAAQNTLYTIVGPRDAGLPLWITQNAWISLGVLSPDTTVTHTSQAEGTGVFIFVIEGAVHIGEQRLGRRDAVGIVETTSVDITSDSNAYVLVIEVPMA